MRFQITVVALIAVLQVSASGAIWIDTFDTPQGPLTGGGSFNAVSGSGILGGERDVALLVFPSTSGFSIGSSTLEMTQTSGFTNAIVTYDGSDNSSNLSMGLANLNLLASGMAFKVDLLTTTSVNPHSHLWIRAYTTEWDYSEKHLVFTASDFQNSIIIPFNSMITQGSGANFASINAVQLELAVGSGIIMDYRVGGISVIPEPSTFCFSLCALAMFALSRRRVG